MDDMYELFMSDIYADICGHVCRCMSYECRACMHVGGRGRRVRERAGESGRERRSIHSTTCWDSLQPDVT